jgi:hypothetical protein
VQVLTLNLSLGECRMKFSEIANRLTGISTPLVGVSWQPTDLEVSAARRVIAFLEDRRVLYAPEEMEVASHCVDSVLEIRRRDGPPLAGWPTFAPLSFLLAA